LVEVSEGSDFCSGGNAAVCAVDVSGSAAAWSDPVEATGDGCCGGRAGGAAATATAGWLTGFGSGAVSTRSSARVGGVASVCCAKTASGWTCRIGRLATSWCAERSSDAAPRPKIITDSDNTIATNRKRKLGSMKYYSTLNLEVTKALGPSGTR
jgi:hypothetical protein